jgi:hypothetical protein
LELKKAEVLEFTKWVNPISWLLTCSKFHFGEVEKAMFHGKARPWHLIFCILHKCYLVRLKIGRLAWKIIFILLGHSKCKLDEVLKRMLRVVDWHLLHFGRPKKRLVRVQGSNDSGSRPSGKNSFTVFWGTENATSSCLWKRCIRGFQGVVTTSETIFIFPFAQNVNWACSRNGCF